VWQTAFETLSGGAVFFTLTIPPGLLTLRLLGIVASPLARLSMAIGLGSAVVLSVLVVELTLGHHWLILPLTVGSLVALRSGPLVATVRALAPELTASILLGALALFANAGDVVRDPDKLSVKVGFDISDRAFYGRVAQELERAPIWAVENPAFSPLPLQYSYLPSLAGVLLHRYASVDALTAFGTCLPAIGLTFTGIAAAALAQAFGSATSLARLLTMVLVVLGGGMSFLVPQINDSWLERTRHFFVFYSFSGESLFYNPWMLGLPLAFVTLLGLSLLLNGSAGAMVVPTAILLSSLFEAKVFAFISLWLAVTALGLFSFDRRLLAVAALSLLLVTPAVILVAMSGGAREGAPLVFDPFAFVTEALSSNPSLQCLAATLGVPIAGAVVLSGGLGFRLLGVPRLSGSMRGSEGGAGRIAALAILLSIGLALTFAGQPNRFDGVQFMLLPLSLMWIFVGPALGAMLGRSGLSRLVAVSIVGLSVLEPIRYLARKAEPEVFTSKDAIDRRRFELSGSTLEACQWLVEHSRTTDRLILPLSDDPEDRGGLKPVYVGLLSARRLVAEAAPFSVSASLARDRQAAVRRFYDTEDPAEAESILKRLRVAWVWENASRPLRFESAKLIPRALFGTTRLLSYSDEP
jgi:hypothetical protein